MKLTLYLHRNLLPGTAAVVFMFLDTLIPAFAPSDHLGQLFWRVPMVLFAALAVVCLIAQLFILSRLEYDREEKYKLQEEKDKERDERFKRIEEGVQFFRVQYFEGKSNPSTADRLFTPQERLQDAQEEIWVNDIVNMAVEDVRLNIAHDSEFRRKFYGTSSKKYLAFDSIRDSIARDAIIAARFVRSKLVPREPFAEMIDQVFSSSNKPYQMLSDFLFEINLVNVTNNSVTIDRIEMEAEIEDKWIPLKIGDLSNYELAFDLDRDTLTSPLIRGIGARVQQLDPLWDQIRGTPMTQGTAKQGWIDFEVEMPNTQSKKPIQHRVRVIDSLGGKHPVLVSTPLDETGRIKHSKKVYAKLREP